jgi:transposase-like protein
MPMPSTNGVEVSPDPQFEKPQRRRFSAEQKLRILKQVDACSDRGEIAVILRREGLYSSHLVAWRRKPIHDAKDREIARLVNRQAQLERELELSRKIVEFQKKAHEILQHVSVPGEKR